MSLDDLESVDAVGTEAGGDTIVLTIIDSWDWGDERGHLLAWQGKLNAYFEFVESGQIYEDYPDAKGRSVCIDIITKYPLPSIAAAFLEKASKTAAQLNLSVTHRQHNS